MRGLVQPMTPALLETFVLSKIYFDRQGLILAFDDDRPIGFVHAGFGPNDKGTAISHELGVTSLLMTTPHPQRDEVAHELLKRSEAYLRQAGATAFYAGGVGLATPFYLGLYGGSGIPGILTSDAVSQKLYRDAGYREIDRCVVLQCQLGSFRPVVDRRQMRVRRQYQVALIPNPPLAHWWQACTLGMARCTRFELRPSRGGPLVGRAGVWDMEPLASGWGVHAAGLFQLEIDPPVRRLGLATHLIGQALRQLHSEGVTVCEVQAMQHQTATLELYRKLGFEEVDQGVIFRKES